jgi:serine/threonine-protein kinase
MAITSVGNFVTAVAEYQLLLPEQLNQLLNERQARFPDLLSLAKEVVRRGWMTTYQVKHLVQEEPEYLLLGPYILIDALGSGAAGQVYKARHKNTGNVVALKVIRPDHLTNPEAIPGLQRELQAAAHLSHPGFVIAHFASRMDDCYFLVMEYVDGVDLARMVQEQGPLGMDIACEYIRQACRLMQIAHDHHLTHHDLKPANLMVSLPENEIKVLDLGLFQLHGVTQEPRSDSTPTNKSSLSGTPDYLAPEQAIDFEAADIRSDIYSLGCTLYYLLTGHPPFPGGSLAQKLMRHQQVAPTAVECLRSNLPPGLPPVLAKMMAKKPEDRYQTPAEAAQALARFSTPSGIITLPELPPVRSLPPDGLERRATVRHPSRMVTPFRKPGDVTGHTWTAKLNDISQTGVGLVVNRRFETGTLLTIQLVNSDVDVERTMTVRVMNVRDRGDGTWMLGCSFSGQLSDDELQAFSAAQVRSAESSRRTWVRLGCEEEASASEPEDPDERWSARILNISANGVGLLSPRYFETGTLLTIDLPDSTPERPHVAMVRVVHVSMQSTGEWALGCAFASKLSADELRACL